MAKIIRAVVSAAVTLCAAAAYPSTFPFENEVYVPPGLESATPSLTFDESDSGGYIYYYGESVTSWEVRDDTPGCENGAPKLPGVQNGHFQYGFVVGFGAPPVLPAATWNCTATNLFFAESDYTGVIAGETLCAVGECCSDWYGIQKFSDDQLDWHSWLSDRKSAALCGDLYEEVYCTLVDGDAKGNCFEFFPSPDVRPIVLHCYDSWVIFWLTCKVYSAGAYVAKYLYEPDSYMALLDLEQTLVVDTYSRMQDQICRPYSYFHPSSTSAPSTSASSTASSDTSSANHLTLLSLCIYAFTLLQ